MQLREAHPHPWEWAVVEKKKRAAALNNFAIIQVLGYVDIPKQLNYS